MARRKRIHGHRRKRSASSPAKFLGGAVGGAINMVKRLRDRKKGSAEANGRAEGSASGEIKGTSSTRMGGLAGMKADMFNRGSMKGGLRGMVERVVDEKLEGGGEKPKESEEKVLKTPKNDATTKELTTSTKDAAADEAVTRLYKQ
jgi:hypothetical protein